MKKNVSLNSELIYNYCSNSKNCAFWQRVGRPAMSDERMVMMSKLAPSSSLSLALGMYDASGHVNT